MVSSQAATVAEYLDELPEERRAVVARVRQTVLDHLPAGYQETMRWGMISYEIPLERYPDTYNGQPLAYIGLAAQKRHYALYLMGVYADSDQERRLREVYAERGLRLDFGKSCLRFRRLEELPLDLIAELVAATPPEAHIAQYEASRKR
jgi:uncharacterized protein YdhG (YjbR/CyaY superfamily)